MDIKRQQMNSANRTTRIPSMLSAERQPLNEPKKLLPAAISGETVLPALERLCSAKRTVELTPHQTETWAASLSVFDSKTVNEVIVRMAHSDDPFPDLGKLVMGCEALRRERSGTVSQGELKLGSGTLKRLAEAWGVDIA